jgi:hypothetical protein
MFERGGVDEPALLFLLADFGGRPAERGQREQVDVLEKVAGLSSESSSQTLCEQVVVGFERPEHRNHELQVG